MDAGGDGHGLNSHPRTGFNVEQARDFFNERRDWSLMDAEPQDTSESHMFLAMLADALTRAKAQTEVATETTDSDGEEDMVELTRTYYAHLGCVPCKSDNTQAAAATSLQAAWRGSRARHGARVAVAGAAAAEVVAVAAAVADAVTVEILSGALAKAEAAAQKRAHRRARRKVRNAAKRAERAAQKEKKVAAAEGEAQHAARRVEVAGTVVAATTKDWSSSATSAMMPTTRTAWDSKGRCRATGSARRASREGVMTLTPCKQGTAHRDSGVGRIVGKGLAG
jgi:hypothetical protein